MPVTSAAPRAAVCHGSAAKSRSQLSASAASERQKNTAVAVGRGDGGEVGLDGTALARQHRGQQGLRPSRRPRGVRGLDRDRRDVRVAAGAPR